jgi:predicted nucleic acid-binding protein
MGHTDAQRRRLGRPSSPRPLTLAIDANLAVEASIASTGFQVLAKQTLVAPALMWSEAYSVLHHRHWRGDLTVQQTLTARAALAQAPIVRVEDARIQLEAWRFADELGWARTYDAEYIAVAHVLGCRLLTIDLRLHRGAKRLGFVITPDEL